MQGSRALSCAASWEVDPAGFWAGGGDPGTQGWSPPDKAGPFSTSAWDVVQVLYVGGKNSNKTYKRRAPLSVTSESSPQGLRSLSAQQPGGQRPVAVCRILNISSVEEVHAFAHFHLVERCILNFGCSEIATVSSLFLKSARSYKGWLVHPCLTWD